MTDSHPAPRTKLVEALAELVCAIDKKWDGEGERRRANALSPRIEDALTVARAVLDAPSDKDAMRGACHDAAEESSGCWRAVHAEGELARIRAAFGVESNDEVIVRAHELEDRAVSCVVDAQLLRDIRHELGERMGFAESAHILCEIDAALAGSQPHLVKAILDPSVYDETEQYIAAAPAAQPNAELGTICPTCKEYVVKPLDERGEKDK